MQNFHLPINFYCHQCEIFLSNSINHFLSNKTPIASKSHFHTSPGDNSQWILKIPFLKFKFLIVCVKKPTAVSVCKAIQNPQLMACICISKQSYYVTTRGWNATREASKISRHHLFRAVHSGESGKKLFLFFTAMNKKYLLLKNVQQKRGKRELNHKLKAC